MKNNKYVITLFVLTIGASLLVLGIRRAESKFQHDADICRLKHLVYFGKLIEEYREKAGTPPLLGESKLKNYVIVASSPLPEGYQGGPPYEHDSTDVETFRRTLEKGVGRKIDLKFDPQKAAVNGPNFYLYMIDGDHYYFAVHLYNAYAFARSIGPHYNKVEISNTEAKRKGLWKFQDLLKDPEFKKALEENPNKEGWCEKFRND